MKSGKISLLVIGFSLLLPSVGAAQAKKAARSATPSSTAAAATPAQDNAAPTKPEQFRQEFIKAAETYQASLGELSAVYETELQRLTTEQDKLKQLYDEGLIARRDLEKSETALTNARTKVADVKAQIEETKTLLLAARQPPPPVPVYVPANPGNPVIAGSGATPFWTTGSRTTDNLIKYYGTQYGVDPYLIYCVMHQESRFGTGATSYKGAMGLMQLMPGTAARYGVTNAYDPAQNIMGGAHYLRDLLQLFNGRIDLVLAGYNAGEGAVMKYGNRVPPYAETRNYVNVIGARYGKTNHVVQPTVVTRPAKRKKKH